VFFLSKIVALLTQPLTWIVTLLSLALLLRNRNMLSRNLISVALAGLLVMGWQPVPDLILRELENQSAEIPPQADLTGYVGMVVLGGATEMGYVAQAHTQPLFNDAAERIIAPVIARHKNPHLRVLYTGGEGALIGHGPTEAQRAQVLFDNIAMAGKQVEYEASSRTTYENAVLTAQLPGVDIRQRWLLVTSAWHMPRSLAVFAKVGWNVTAYPVDFRTGPSTPWTEYSLREGVNKWQLVLHELVGQAAYRMTGRS
jgi:uncharacterized SAM-binding protein YcdF (DUF218 family)